MVHPTGYGWWMPIIKVDRTLSPTVYQGGESFCQVFCAPATARAGSRHTPPSATTFTPSTHHHHSHRPRAPPRTHHHPHSTCATLPSHPKSQSTRLQFLSNNMLFLTEGEGGSGMRVWCAHASTQGTLSLSSSSPPLTHGFKSRCDMPKHSRRSRPCREGVWGLSV